MNTPPKWIGAAFLTVGLIGLVLMVNPTAGALCVLVVTGAAGLILFAAVCIGRFDAPSSLGSFDSSSDSAGNSRNPTPEGTRRPADQRSEG